jgi:hypothetical protein
VRQVLADDPPPGAAKYIPYKKNPQSW